MKSDTHPTYYPEAVVECTCGNRFIVGSTKERVSVEICYKCHPFYTGKEKLVDAAGRIEKFKAKIEKGRTAPKSQKIRTKKPQRNDRAS